MRYNSEYFYVMILKNECITPASKKPFFSNGSVAKSISAEVFNLEQKKKFIYFLYKNI